MLQHLYVLVLIVQGRIPQLDQPRVKLVDHNPSLMCLFLLPPDELHYLIGPLFQFDQVVPFFQFLVSLGEGLDFLLQLLDDLVVGLDGGFEQFLFFVRLIDIHHAFRLNFYKFILIEFLIHEVVQLMEHLAHRDDLCFQLFLGFAGERVGGMGNRVLELVVDLMGWVIGNGYSRCQGCSRSCS